MKNGRLPILLFISLMCYSGVLAQSSLTVHDSIVLKLDEALYSELNSLDSNIKKSYVFSDLGGNERYYFIRSLSDYNYASESRREALGILIPHIVDLALANIRAGEDALENYILVHDLFQIVQFFPPMAPYQYNLGKELIGYEKYLIQDGQIALPESMRKSNKEVVIQSGTNKIVFVQKRSQEWLDWWNGLSPEEQIRHDDAGGGGYPLPASLASSCMTVAFSHHGNLEKEKRMQIMNDCRNQHEYFSTEFFECMAHKMIQLHEQGILKYNTSK